MSVLLIFAVMLAEHLYNVPQPMIVEVLRDVKVSGAPGEGDLHILQTRLATTVPLPAPFVIKKGEQFETLGRFSGGACRIRFRRRITDLTECRWLDGFADRQTDTFKLIASQQTK